MADWIAAFLSAKWYDGPHIGTYLVPAIIFQIAVWRLNLRGVQLFRVKQGNSYRAHLAFLLLYNHALFLIPPAIAATPNQPHLNSPEALWQAYTMLEKSKVHGRLQATADLISLVRFALEQATVLAPFSETVNDRFAHWLSSQQAAGSVFTPDQLQWLTMIRDHIAASLTVEPEDFEYVPFSERGGLGRATTLFGDRLPTLLTELTEALTS